MVSLLLAAAVSLQGPPAPSLKLQADFTWGEHGPTRQAPRLDPRDWTVISLRAEGLSPDSMGRVNAVIRTEIRDARGEVAEAKRQELGVVNFWKTGALRYAWRRPLDPSLAPGAYKACVTLLDRHTGQEATAELPFEIVPVGFALLGPLFSLDPAGAILCGPQGLTMQTVFVRVGVIGHALSSGKSKATAILQVIAADGQLVHEMKSEPLELVSSTLSFTCPLTLMRPGDFRLKLTVTDDIAKASRTVEVPLRVREP